MYIILRKCKAQQKLNWQEILKLQNLNTVRNSEEIIIQKDIEGLKLTVNSSAQYDNRNYDFGKNGIRPR